MSLQKMKFVNELGNEIEMSVCASPHGVTVKATGPRSTVEHTWTTMEANRLLSLLATMDNFPEEPPLDAPHWL